MYGFYWDKLYQLYTEYLNVQTLSLRNGDTFDLTSTNYPGNTYAESKWIITSDYNKSVSLTFPDVNLSFGASLTLGSGKYFSTYDYLFKLGTADIPIDENSSMYIMTTPVWIWFQTTDLGDETFGQTNVDLEYSGSFKFDSIPSVRGIRLRLRDQSGESFFPYLYHFKRKFLSYHYLPE